MKKALLYPYDISNLCMILYKELLSDIDIIKCISPSGWGYEGEDAGEKIGIETGIGVCSDFCNNIEAVDIVIILDSIITISEEDVLNKTQAALECKKEIKILRKLSLEASKKIKEMEQLQGTSIQLFDNNEDIGIDLEDIPNKYKLKEVKKPVITILGVGERCNKFDMQLEVRKRLKKAGYKVTQIGSKSFCKFFGFHSFPKFMLEDKQSTTNKIINFNRYVNHLCEKEKSDVVILGVPGGIYPYNDQFHNDFGFINYMVSNAIKPDYSILCLLYVDCFKEYASELRMSLKYHYQYDIDHVFISNTGVNWFKTKSIQELTHITIKQDFIERCVAESGIGSIFNESDKEAMYQNMIDTLGMYGDMSVV